MATEYKDIIRIETYKSLMSTVLREGQSGFCSDTYEFAHKFVGGTVKYYPSLEALSIAATQVSYTNIDHPSATTAQTALDDLYSNSATGSGTSGYLPVLATNVPYTLTNSALIEVAGKIGIGTTDPQEVLHVVGNLHVSNEIYTTQWTDYSSTSTIVGFTGGFTTKYIFYKKLGKSVFCEFVLNGTSDSASCSFTLPDSANTDFPGVLACHGIIETWDDDTHVMGRLTSDSSNVFSCHHPWTNGWKTSGQKYARGSFWYQTD